MADSNDQSCPIIPGIDPDKMIPTLTEEQIARIAAFGKIRKVKKGEILLDLGDQNLHFYVVKKGHIEVVQYIGTTEKLFGVYHANQFTGELSLVSGRPAFVKLRVSEPGEVIEVERENLLKIIQTDPEWRRNYCRWGW